MRVNTERRSGFPFTLHNFQFKSVVTAKTFLAVVISGVKLPALPGENPNSLNRVLRTDDVHVLIEVLVPFQLV